VVGAHDRSGGISRFEKKGKSFNWQLPTAKVSGSDLIIQCYPGKDYVKHNASLIGSYLALHQRKYEHVTYTLPAEETLWKALSSSNLSLVPKGDVAILGSGLNQLIDEEVPVWQGSGDFSWKEKQIHEKPVVYIGCRHSYRGDIVERIVALLAKKGFKELIFIGKLAGIRPESLPNVHLATGNSSFVDGKIIQWKNRFEFAKCPELIFGDHVTCSSIMIQTREWRSFADSFSFVDSEIGRMAKAAESAKIGFSYLHIVSDNIGRSYEESNAAALNKQNELLKIVKSLIEKSV
jgi:hypothetical protein